MVKVKKFIGFVLIGMAVYIIRPILDEAVFYLLLNSLLTTAIFYYLFFTENKITIIKVILIIGLLLSVFFNVYLTKDYIKKDVDLLSLEEKPQFITINSVDELNNIITSNDTKPIMLDFYADWCVACLEFEKFTFTNKEVKAIMKQYILLKADVTNNNLNDKELMKKFNIFGPPAIIFFNNSGVEIRQIRTIGFKNAKEFKKILQIGLNK
jgi:thiol:disulfide interchange protein DsbD